MHIDYSVITIVSANIGLIYACIASNKKAMQEMRDEMTTLYLHTDKKIDAIAQEMKDFHGRLCAIEERKKLAEGK
jgi:hypothetical protein